MTLLLHPTLVVYSIVLSSPFHWPLLSADYHQISAWNPRWRGTNFVTIDDYPSVSISGIRPVNRKYYNRAIDSPSTSPSCDRRELCGRGLLNTDDAEKVSYQLDRNIHVIIVKEEDGLWPRDESTIIVRLEWKVTMAEDYLTVCPWSGRYNKRGNPHLHVECSMELPPIEFRVPYRRSSVQARVDGKRENRTVLHIYSRFETCPSSSRSKIKRYPGRTARVSWRIIQRSWPRTTPGRPRI